MKTLFRTRSNRPPQETYVSKMEPEQKAPEETAEQERMPLKEISLITESRVKLGPLIAVEMYSPVDGELTRIVYVQSVNIKDSDPDGPPEISLWEVRRMLDLREDAPLFHWEGMDSSRCYFRRNVLGPKISEAPAPLQNYTQDLVTPGGLPTLPLCTTFSGGVKVRCSFCPQALSRMLSL